MSEPHNVPSRHFEQTAAITPQLRADGVKKIVDVAQKHKLTTAGIFSSSESVEGIFNSRGLSDWHTQTLAEVSITMLGADSSGWQKANSPDVTNLDPLALAEIAAKKALDSAHPAEIPAGKYTVILEPAAVLDIVGFMFWDYSGTAILDQRSFLNGRIGSSFSVRTSPSGTMSPIRCKLALPLMAKACGGCVCRSSRKEWSSELSMRGARLSA